MRYLFISLLLTGLLSACGFKGPLTLPERPAPVAKPVAAKPVAATPAHQEASQPAQPVKDANQP